MPYKQAYDDAIMFTYKRERRRFSELSRDINNLDPDTGLSPIRRTFLDEHYLAQPYIVPPEVEGALREVTHLLTLQAIGITCITHVGSTANGSLALRRLEGSRSVTNLDYYFMGYGIPDAAQLDKAARLVSRTLKLWDIMSEGSHGGREADNYLDLDAIDAHIQEEDYHLLALPFQSSFGGTEEAREIVLQSIIDHPNGQHVWDKVADSHIQSLSLHHGSWDEAFSATIIEDFYPRKIEKFQLPGSPVDALSDLRGY